MTFTDQDYAEAVTYWRNRLNTANKDLAEEIADMQRDLDKHRHHAQVMVTVEDELAARGWKGDVFDLVDLAHAVATRLTDVPEFVETHFAVVRDGTKETT